MYQDTMYSKRPQYSLEAHIFHLFLIISSAFEMVLGKTSSCGLVLVSSPYNQATVILKADITEEN